MITEIEIQKLSEIVDNLDDKEVAGLLHRCAVELQKRGGNSAGRIGALFPGDPILVWNFAKTEKQADKMIKRILL